MRNRRRSPGCTLLVSVILAGHLTATAVAAGDSLFRLIAQADTSTEDAAPLDTSLTDETRTAAINEIPTEHPLFPAIQHAQGSLTKMQAVTDYEANFIKQERVAGRLLRQSMQLRFRERPFSVYLRYGGELPGREVLYVQGTNGNQMYVHEGSGLKSLVGTVSLATDSTEVMEENRYPVTMIGMKRMLETILDQWQEETRYGEIDVKFYPNAKLAGRPCKVIESSHPQRRRQFKFHKTRLFIDSETKLPVRVEQYGFPPMPGAKAPLEEEYTYSEIRTNVGLTDRDFRTDHPAYNF